MKIKGINKLTKEHQELIFRTHEKHIACNGRSRQEGMAIVETWIDEKNCVCVRFKNGEWYHYTKNGAWY